MKKAILMAAILLAATMTGCSTTASALTVPAEQATASVITTTNENEDDCQTAEPDMEEETNAYGKHPGECGYGYCD